MGAYKKLVYYKNTHQCSIIKRDMSDKEISSKVLGLFSENFKHYVNPENKLDYKTLWDGKNVNQKDPKNLQ